MRFSIKSLMLFIVAFCVSLGLTWLPYGMGAIVLAIIAICLIPVMPFHAWWRMSLGALLASFACLVIALVCGIGYLISEYNEPATIRAYQQRWLTTAIQLGAFAGGSLGLLLDRNETLNRD